MADLKRSAADIKRSRNAPAANSDSIRQGLSIENIKRKFSTDYDDVDSQVAPQMDGKDIQVEVTRMTGTGEAGVDAAQEKTQIYYRGELFSSQG